MFEQKPKAVECTQQLDSFLACFSYSPNWFTEQSVCVDPFYPNLLYYASNHLLYVYDKTSKQLKQEVSAKVLMKEYLQKSKHKDTIGEKEMKSLKLFCIYATENCLVLGLNDGIIVVVDRNFNCKLVYRVKIRNIVHLQAFENGHQVMNIVVFDDVGYCVKISLRQWGVERLEVKIEQQPDKKDRVKRVVYLNSQHYCFYQRGHVYIFDQGFDKLVRRLTYSRTQTILYVSSFDNRIIMLCKDKDILILSYFRIQKGLQFVLEHTKTIFEITKSVLKCKIEIEYPKKYQYKRDQMRKAALCVEWISESKFMMTGRLAEIYIFDMANLPKSDKITLKPFSMEDDENPVYKTLPESKHYDEIYQIYRIGTQIITVGTDRNMNFWQVRDQSELRFSHNIKFLGSSVKQIVTSESERSVLSFLMTDSIIRSWDMGREDNEYKLNQYWKASQKLKLIEMKCHPTQQGVVALLTNENKLVLYDMYQERQIRLMQLQTIENCSVKFVSSELTPRICQLFEAELVPLKLETKELWKRNVSDKHWVMVELANSLVLINVSKDEAFSCSKYFKLMKNDEKVQSIECLNNKIIVAWVRSATSLYLKLKIASTLLEYRVAEQYSKYRYTCQLVDREDRRFIYLSVFDKKDHHLFVLNVEKDSITQYKTISLPFTYFIEGVQFSPNGNRVIAYSLLSNTIQLWELQYNLAEKQSPIVSISKNIKAHFGNVIKACFFQENFVASSSHDQNIKVWDIRKCQERKPPKANKNRKKKNSQHNKSTAKISQQGKQESESEEQLQNGPEKHIQPTSQCKLPQKLAKQ